jgi:insulysin
MTMNGRPVLRLLVLLGAILGSTGLGVPPFSGPRRRTRDTTRRPCHPDSHQENDSAAPPPTTHGSWPRRDVLAAAAASIGVGWGGGTGMPPAAAAAAATTHEEDSSAVPYANTRRYKTVILANGLRVLLVQDKRVFQAAAALSVGGAGQWADPEDLPGLAHLCEHMVLSSTTTAPSVGARRRRPQPRTASQASQQAPAPPQAFEEWLADVAEGSSNAFTAYDNVCFHFTCPDAYFQQGLERFSNLFLPPIFDAVCRNEATLQREIARVDSEVHWEDSNLQAASLSKAFINPVDHPYARFSMGHKESLSDIPRATGVDVGERLQEFFRQRYRPQEAVLVVTAPHDSVTLQRWVMPFSVTLSRNPAVVGAAAGRDTTHPQQPPLQRRFYPGGFLQGSRLKQMVLFRDTKKEPDDQIERLIMEWILNLDYTDAIRNGQPVVTATQIAFLVAQILGRRGPGSLYFFLSRRGWVPTSHAALPRVSLPVQVSGFQILKLELTLTREGFLNRSAVVATVRDTLEALRRRRHLSAQFYVARELVSQWASVAKLHGYLLSPRPPDAIELTQDVHLYGLNGPNGVGSGSWYRFPEADDRAAIATLQKSLAATLSFMSDPENAVVIATASETAIEQAGLPLLESSRRWRYEPLTGGRFLYDDMMGLTSRMEELVLTRLVNQEELLRPSINSLVPIILKPPRPRSTTVNLRSVNDINVLPPMVRESEEPSREFRLLSSSRTDRKSWTLLEPSTDGQVGLALPPAPLEPNYRTVFVVQLLSSRPARASTRQAAQGELWKISLEYAVADLAELGAPGALSYDMSFNKYGMRLSFLGVSQNLPSYTRRLCRSLVDHHSNLLKGQEIFSRRVTTAAVAEARRTRGLSQQRRGQLVSSLRRTKTYAAAAEGEAFLRSCTGAVCFAQGDWDTTGEVLALQSELEGIFSPYTSTGRATLSAVPTLNDLIYIPIWKPRFGSPCSLAGIQLISDTCGRVPR